VASVPPKSKDIPPKLTLSFANEVLAIFVKVLSGPLIVLPVKTCVPTNVATVPSIAIDKESVATPVVVIPVPPCTFKVSVVEIVWSEPPSPEIVNAEEILGVPGSNLLVELL